MSDVITIYDIDIVINGKYGLGDFILFLHRFDLLHTSFLDSFLHRFELLKTMYEQPQNDVRSNSKWRVNILKTMAFSSQNDDFIFLKRWLTHL